MPRKPGSRLSIPVQLVDGVWEFAMGGAVPVGAGALAELVVERRAILDRTFLKLMERRERHKVLDEGTPLLIGLTIKPSHPPPESLNPLLTSYWDIRSGIAAKFFKNISPQSQCFVEVRLAGPDAKQRKLFDTDRGGLWLVTEGLKATGLDSTTILLPPAVSDKPVASLNHAFTKLSEVFEPWRISHTGNVYTRVLYQERNGTWYPLDVLRNMTLDRQEHEIARDLWQAFLSRATTPAKPQRRK